MLTYDEIMYAKTVGFCLAAVIGTAYTLVHFGPREIGRLLVFAVREKLGRCE